MIKIFRKIFETFGICENLTMDGGRQFIAGEFEDFLNRFGVKHHQSSAYTPHSNLRAESAVKSVKKSFLKIVQ